MSLNIISANTRILLDIGYLQVIKLYEIRVLKIEPQLVDPMFVKHSIQIKRNKIPLHTRHNSFVKFTERSDCKALQVYGLRVIGAHLPQGVWIPNPDRL